MRRGHAHESHMKIFDKIKDKAPDASVCGNVVVGFPGETDEGFQRALDLMEEVKVSLHLHDFFILHFA